MIRVLTIEREYGAGGGGISQALAEELGWKLWDSELSNAIARRLKCDIRSVERAHERPDSVFYRLFKVFMRGSFEATLQAGPIETMDGEHLASVFHEVITDIAAKGNCVIVGRGAPWFLRERRDGYHVFLYASREEKIRRTIAGGMGAEEAEHMVDTVDRERAAFVKQYYGKDWPDRYLYNLLINTKAGNAIVVQTILDGINSYNAGDRLGTARAI
jgi:cytidylate kinase